MGRAGLFAAYAMVVLVATRFQQRRELADVADTVEPRALPRITLDRPYPAPPDGDIVPAKPPTLRAWLNSERKPRS